MRGLAGSAVLTIVLAIAPRAGAQETTTGSIEGEVLDPQAGALRGAVVTLTSGQGKRSFETDRRGHFLAPYLTPDIYAVRVAAPGFAAEERTGVSLRLGQRLELTFVLKLSVHEESIQAAGSSAAVDSSSTTVGGVLSSEELSRLPVPRRFTSTLYMVPGVSNSSGVGEANPSIAGASGLENHYVVDGVNITNPAYGSVGVYTDQFGSLGTGVTTDFIQETEVKTAGYEAEYGQATGGVVNVITRSGANAFHGSVFSFWRPHFLEASWRQQQTALGEVNTLGTQALDLGVDLGGPLVKDRLFFFAAFNPLYESTTLVAPEGFPLSSEGPVDRRRRSLSYAGKLTWQGGQSQRLDVTVFGDPSYGAAGPQRMGALLAQDPSRFSDLPSYGGHNQALRYSGTLGSKWLVEATVGHAATGHTERPTIDTRAVTDRTVVPFVSTGGLGFFESSTHGDNLQLALKSTHVLSAAGSQEVRYGVQFERVEFSRPESVTGPPLTFPDGTLSSSGVVVNVLSDPVFGRIYRAGGLSGIAPISTQSYLSWFAQDTWRIGRRLTLRPGIRWERQRLEGGSPVCYSDESFVGAGDGTPGHEIDCTYTWSNNWAPRLGATWDVGGGGRSRLYASWGRYYAQIPTDLADRALSSQATLRADYFDAELTRPVPEGVLAARTTQHFVTFGGEPDKFANGSRSTYQDELAAGFEIEAAPSLSVGARYVRRRLQRVLEDYSPAAIVAYDLGCPGLETTVYLIGNISPALPKFDCEPSAGISPSQARLVSEAGFEKPVHDYDAVELTAQKAFSRSWSLLASYRWSRLRGNFEGFYRADNGQSDPALSSLFDFPTDDPSYAGIGVPQFGYRGDVRYQGATLGTGALPNDRPHQIKIYGAYAWRGFNSGVGFRAGSGAPLTALSANPTYGNGGEIPETVRGAGIQTVDGFRRRGPAELAVDVHVDRAFGLRRKGRLLLGVDVFNLLDRRDPITYDSWTEITFGVPNPDFGKPAAYGGSPLTAFEAPREVQLVARIEW